MAAAGEGEGIVALGVSCGVASIGDRAGDIDRSRRVEARVGVGVGVFLGAGERTVEAGLNAVS